MPWIEPEFVAIEPGTDTVRSRLDLEALRDLDLSSHHRGMIRYPGVCGIEQVLHTIGARLATIFPEAKHHYPYLTRLRGVRFPGRISPTTVRVVCLLDDAKGATFSIIAMDEKERLATQGKMEFVLVETPQPPVGFNLVSRVVEVDKDQRKLVAEYDYTGREVFDLTGLAYFSETLIIEALARGAMLIGQGNAVYTNKLFWFTGIESAEFLEPVPRQGILDLLAEISQTQEKTGSARCWALYRGKLVASATITFAITRGKATS